MINGAHVLLYSKDPDADRAFFRNVLQWRHVDAGHGWLIFKLPASEVAVHPLDGDPSQTHAGHAMIGAVLYLMCDNLDATLAALDAKRIGHTEIEKEPWGIRTTVVLPSGGEVGLYQPLHPTATTLA